MEQLGNRLINEGLISQVQLDQACERQRQFGGRIGENLVALGYLAQADLERFFKMNPQPPQTIAETGLEIQQLTDLVLKHILSIGEIGRASCRERVWGYV